jgi:hypothetical protein
MNPTADTLVLLNQLNAGSPIDIAAICPDRPVQAKPELSRRWPLVDNSARHRTDA